MMRTTSAAEGKGNARHHNDIPAPGTKIRTVFDLFYPPLTIVSLLAIRRASGKDNPGDAIEYLRNFYGLDIRKHHSAHWWLVGEYFPGGYLDYAAESYEELEQRRT